MKNKNSKNNKKKNSNFEEIRLSELARVIKKLNQKIKEQDIIHIIH